MGQPMLQFSLKNDSAKPLIVYVEMTPERYVLDSGETLEILGQAPQHPPSFVWHDEGLTIFPGLDGVEEHRINGIEASSRSWM